MNKVLKYLGIIIGFVALFAVNGCEDNIDPVVDELKFDRVFTPLELEAKISNQTTVSLSWGFNKGIDSYVVEISDDSLQFNSIIHTADVAPDELPYVFDLPAGNSLYSVRVKGVSSVTADSKWATLAFRSLPENLFNRYNVVMTALGEITVNWTPGKTVTSMVFISSTGVSSFDITAEEQAAGVKNFTNVPNAVYQIRLMNNNKVRGFQNYVVEGDVFIESGADLAAAITAASSGDVIVLAAGGSYGFVGDMYVNKSFKIKGLDGDLPIIYITEGDRMFIIDESMTTADSLVFEKIHMSGFPNNDNSMSGIRGVFDQESGWPCSIGLIKFKSCELSDYGRHLLRLRGNDNGQYINTLEVDDCIIHDIGSGSGSYGVVSSTAETANIEFIKFSNSTVYEIRPRFMRYTDAVTCQSIIVDKCTFNRVAYDSGSERQFIDLNGTVFTGSGLEIRNSIMGETQAGVSRGIRIEDESSLSISNTYATSDYDDSAGNAIIDLLIPYGGSSTTLWNDPVNGDFSYNDDTFDGSSTGDPRWNN